MIGNLLLGPIRMQRALIRCAQLPRLIVELHRCLQPLARLHRWHHHLFGARSVPVMAATNEFKSFKPSRLAAPLHVEISHVERVLFDEFAARLNHVTHELGEDLVGFFHLFDFDFEQVALGRIHRGFPQLFRVHFA